MKNLYYKVYYIAAIVALTATVIFFGVILPLIKNTKAKSADFITTLGQINHLYDDWFLLKTAEKSLKKIDESRLENVFLDPDQSLNFILAVENIVKKNNLYHEIKVLTLSPVSSSQSGSAPNDQKINNQKATLPFQITLWGAFPNLMRFLNNLENLPYFVEVDSFQIYGLSDKDLNAIKSSNLNIGDIRAILNIKVYAK